MPDMSSWTPLSGTVMIGSFPPPVGGAALVNQMVLEGLSARGMNAVPLDVSGPALAHSRSLGYHTRRVMVNLAAARRARLLAKESRALYLVPDAGAGAWYTAGLVRAAADRFTRIVIHHHSCRYVEEQSRPIAWLTQRTSATATHVFLSDGMGEAFCRRYGEVRRLVATNALFVAQEAELPMPAPTVPSGPLRLGHLSNLCADKGFFAVADAFDAIRGAGIDATLLLAGPVLEPTVQLRIAELTVRHGNRLRYIGPVGGEAKRAVYRELDLFLFPTRFRQEAAPLVLYEAIAAGVPVLATDRGVIAELLKPPMGAVCARNADFTAFALAQVRAMLAAGPGRADRAQAIKGEMRERCARSAAQYEALFALLGAPVSESRR